MSKAVMVMVLWSLAAGGCDKGNEDGKEASPAASAEDAETAKPKKSGLDGKELVALAEGYAKAVCECKKAQCINKAGEDYQAATNKLYSDKKARNPTPEQRKQMDAAQAKVKECTDELLKK